MFLGCSTTRTKIVRREIEVSNYYEGSGAVSPQVQASDAYRQMRLSLIKFAAVEAEMLERVNEEKMTPTLESILVSRAHAWRDRAVMFALVYQVEMDVFDRRR